MPSQVSECFVLRSWPFGEGDLIVSWFTREHGKMRGVAKRARRMKSGFGSGLERLSQVRMQWYRREGRELASLYSCEVISSQFSLASSYECGLAMDLMAEVCDYLLPLEDPNEKYYRLLNAVLQQMREQGEAQFWPCVLYFLLWSVRLGGFLAELRVSPESRTIAEEMLRLPPSGLTTRDWDMHTAADLRRFLVRLIEQQLERKLQTARLLERTLPS
jgi:DNA repair protein RecO (recombination protein O)